MIGKLIKQVTVFGMIWFVAMYLICIFLPFHYFNREYPMWKSKMDLMEEGPSTYRNLVFGDSRAIAGLETKDLGESYFNMALGGATPMEGYFMLKKMLENGKKIDTLIVSYSPIHFEQSEMFWDRQLKYGFYDMDDVDYIFNTMNTDNETFWAYDGPSRYEDGEKASFTREAFLNIMRFPTEYRVELSKSFLLRGVTNFKIQEEIVQRRGSFDFGTAAFSNSLNVEAKRDSFRPKKVIVKSLRMLLDLADLNGIQVLYTHLPMNEASYQALGKTYAKGVMQLEEELRSEFPGVAFVNPSLFAYENRFFGDDSHLNVDGRKKFTEEFKSLVANLPDAATDSFTQLTVE